MAAVEVSDDVGRTIALAAPARRIVSLVPATTELLFAIGAGDAVVGRTQWCDYPEAALAVPSVGDGIGPNLELVVGRRPDLVLLYASADRRAAEQFARLGIPAMALSTNQLADVPRLARLLGRVPDTRTARTPSPERWNASWPRRRRLMGRSGPRFCWSGTSHR